MLVIIIVTANLGPQQGPKRIAALTAAVILSAGTGALLRGMVLWEWPWWVGEQWDIAVDMLSYVWPR
jgi:hypothetical protein